MPGANQIIGSLRIRRRGSAGPGTQRRRLIQKQFSSVTGQVNSLRCGGFQDPHHQRRELHRHAGFTRSVYPKSQSDDMHWQVGWWLMRDCRPAWQDLPSSVA